MAQEIGIAVALDYEVEAAKYTPTVWPQTMEYFRKGTVKPDPTHFAVEPVYVADRVPLKRVDAWGVRSEFLSIPVGDIEKLCGFFNRRGIWSESHKGKIETKKLVSGLGWKVTKVEIDVDPYWFGSMVEIEEIWKDQQGLKKALLEGPEVWFSERKKTLTFQTTARAPHLLQTDSCLKEAIYTTVTLDFLRGLHFDTCPRQDCGLPFLVDHKAKQFCSQYCAHLVSLRRIRANAKEIAEDARREKSIRSKKQRTGKR